MKFFYEAMNNRQSSFAIVSTSLYFSNHIVRHLDSVSLQTKKSTYMTIMRNFFIIFV